MQPLEDDLNIELGCCYGSARVHENPRESKGRIGSRAPHVWLERNGDRISTLDLFGRNFVLLAGPEGMAWEKSAGTGVDFVRIGDHGISDPQNTFCDAFAITPSGAVLVRPDGFVAWRSQNFTPAASGEVSTALASLLCRGH